MLHAVALPPGARVLDVGCGSGWTSLFLAEAGYRRRSATTSSRPTSSWRGAARRALGLVARRFEVADMERPAPGGSPPTRVLLFDALHHSRAPAARSLRAIARPVCGPAAGCCSASRRGCTGVSPERAAPRAASSAGWSAALTLRGLRARPARRGLRRASAASSSRTRPYAGPRTRLRLAARAARGAPTWRSLRRRTSGSPLGWRDGPPSTPGRRRLLAALEPDGRAEHRPRPSSSRRSSSARGCGA